MTAEIIQFRIERQDDGEARISDVELAERIGYADVKDFRALIRRHKDTLGQFGFLRTVRGNSDGRGRPTFGFMLNEQQSIFVVAKCDMPMAVAITVEVVKAFVAYRRGTINPKLYGVVGMEMLGFSPRTWKREYPEAFFRHLHRITGWPRPEGNNHSNCAHFINKYVYEFLFGKLGLAALKEANPADEGQRAHKHHQILKDKHMPRLRQHIEMVSGILALAVSLDMFDDSFNRVFPKPDTQIGFLFGERPGSAA